MIVDHANRRVLDVLGSRDKGLIVSYLRQHKEGLLAKLEEVTCDTWDAYVNASVEVFGEKIRVTIDRFHVMKSFQGQLSGLSKEEAKQLKGTRWLWQTNAENLTAEQREPFHGLQEQFPSLKKLMDQREGLRAIFEDRTIRDAASGQQRLQGSIEQAKASGLKALEKISKTLSNWMAKIANCFVWRSSNGRTEGYNHGLRAILWRAYGMLNFRHFRLRVLDRFDSPTKS